MARTYLLDTTAHLEELREELRFITGNFSYPQEFRDSAQRVLARIDAELARREEGNGNG